MRTLPTILAAMLLGASSFMATVGPEMVLPASPLSAHEPCVTYGEGNYLVVWQSGKAEKADLYGCLLNGSGRPLDSKPFVISKAVECQERPRAAWGKGSWLVVWGDLRSDKDYDIYSARVTSEGKVLDPDGIPIAVGEHNQAQPDVAFNGRHWLAVWRSFVAGKYVGFGVRIGLDGKPVDAAPIKVGEEKGANLSVGELRVGATTDGQWLAAWVSRVSSLSYPAGGGEPEGLYASSISADGRATTSQLCRRGEGDGQPKPPVTLASNGKDAYLLSWFNSGTGSRSGPQSGMPYGALRTNAEGKVLNTTELGGKKVEIKQPAAAWDGKGYLVAFWDGQRADPGRGVPRHLNRVVAHLVAEDGKYEGVIEISPGDPNPAYAPAACGDGKGNCLVVYERHPDKPGDKILIAARVVKR